MANGITHQLVASVVVGTACFYSEPNQQEKSGKPLAGTALAAVFTNLPDVFEPALHPNHRQFFHSWAFAGILGLTAHKIYKWEPDNSFDASVRFVLLVGSAAYLLHLFLDAGTPKSLPLIGKF